MFKKGILLITLFIALLSCHCPLVAETKEGQDPDPDPVAAAMSLCVSSDQDNSIELSYENNVDSEILEDLVILPGDVILPPFLELTGIEPKKPVDLKPGEAKQFSIQFHVKPGTPNNARGVIQYKFTVAPNQIIVPDPTEWEFQPFIYRQEPKASASLQHTIAPPRLAEALPSMTNYPDIHMNGLTEPDALAAIIVDGRVQTMSFADDRGFFWFQNFTLPEGEYMIQVAVSAETSDGYTVTPPKQVVIDLTKPSIACNHPNTPIHTDYDPEIVVDDGHLRQTRCYVNGKPWPLKQPITQEGYYLLRVWASDQAGNEAEAFADIFIDKTPPVIKTEGISENGFYNHPLTVTVTPQDATLMGTSAYLDNSLLADPVQRYASSIDQLTSFATNSYQLPAITREGDHTLLIEAEDGAGNMTKSVFHFELDFQSPTLTVTGVEDGQTYQAPVTPQISVSDRNLETTEITLNEKPFQSGTAIIAKGQYSLKIFARDKAGNIAEKVLQFQLR